MTTYPSQIDRAWAAGLLDGEGFVGIARGLDATSRGGIKHQPSVQIAMCSRTTIERWASLFGGTARPRASNQTRKELWKWQTRNIPEVKTLLQSLQEFVWTKRDQVQLLLDALEVWGEKDPRGTLPEDVIYLRDAYYWALREAKI